MSARDPIGHGEPPFTLPREPQTSRAWDHPLTPTVMCVLAFAVAFVVVLAIAGALP